MKGGSVFQQVLAAAFHGHGFTRAFHLQSNTDVDRYDRPNIYVLGIARAMRIPISWVR